MDSIDKWLKRLFWPLLVLTIACITVMMVWTIPTLAQFTGGIDIFDTRFSGYTFDEAKELLTALGPEGIRFYGDFQHLFDTIYPALSAAFFFVVIVRLSPPSWGIWRLALGLIVLPACIYDYLENSMVKFMLFLGPMNINEEIVGWASQRTVVKFNLLSLTLLVVIALLILWFVRRFTRQNKPI